MECPYLTTLIIPSDSILENIKFGAFSKCTQFSTIQNSSPNFYIYNSALFNKDLTELFILPPASPIKYFSIPPELKIIRQQAFSGCLNLLIVFIPENSVETIESNAFEYCSNLKSINIPMYISFIGVHAFKGCRNLECGLIIENRTKDFIDSLVESSLLPKRCILNCIYRCTRRNFPSLYSCRSSYLHML